MKMRQILMIGILALARTVPAPGQADLEERLEDLGQSLPALAERLDEWRKHPIDLNRADPEDLAGLPLLDDREVRKIIRERKKGPFLSWQDLMARAGLDSARLSGIRAFVAIG
ncbi:helix-hairpin-helix domain-containing protein, partial [bacterium]|nr:helix-hairpin-helix domain-containing protein [bacterium]